jgi:hypothetical protein
MRLIVDIPQQVERADRMMQRNHKLTKVIAGRTIKAVTTEPGSVLVLFDDQPLQAFHNLPRHSKSIWLSASRVVSVQALSA